jgi:antitoxin component YwqK of YwqJK toxin-antitoxin module
MNLCEKQIKKIFSNEPFRINEGYWFSGIENEGEYKEWHENGILYLQRFYKNSKREGEHKLWHYNGQLAVHCFYENGKKNGELKEWGEDGKPTKYEIWKYGELIQKIK